MVAEVLTREGPQLQVPLLWSEVVEPFILEHPDLGLPGGQAGYDLYRWATCAVASYSFILGDDKYQVCDRMSADQKDGRLQAGKERCSRAEGLAATLWRKLRMCVDLCGSGEAVGRCLWQPGWLCS